MRAKPLLFACALLAAATPAVRAASPASVTVEQPWARATPGAVMIGVVYLRIRDAAAGDMLTGASTPVAGSAMLHESYREGGVDKMRMLDGVALPKDQTVSFAPGGKHIMLMGLKQKLVAGETFPLTLDFAHAAPVTVTVKVMPIGATGPAADAQGMSMPGMSMPGMDMSK